MPIDTHVDFQHGQQEEKSKKAKSFAFFLLLIAEIFLSILLLLNIIPAILLGLIHIIIIAVMAIILWRKRTQDLTNLVLGFIITMIAGGVGAASFLLFTFFKRFSKPPKSNLMDEWYERLSSSAKQTYQTKKFEHIYNGRAAGLGHMSVQHFAKVMAGNALHDKQTLLGIIALKYRPEYLPIIKNALADKEPTIRVQAAAAFTKLRTHFKNLLKENSKATTIDMSNPKAPNLFSTKILALFSCIQSGLLDETETKDIKAYLKALQSSAVAHKFPRSQETDLVFASLLQEDGQHEEARHLLEDYLKTGNKDVQNQYTQCLLALKQFDKLSSIQTINP